MFCRTCKVYADVGYGSYTTWLDECRSTQEFDKRVAQNPQLGELAKNVRVRLFLSSHDGHDVSSYNEDCTDIRQGRVYGMGSYGAESSYVIVGNSDDGWSESKWPS